LVDTPIRGQHTTASSTSFTGLRWNNTSTTISASALCVKYQKQRSCSTQFC
jgi:hypothetical protein